MLDGARLCAREIAEKIAAPHDWTLYASDVKVTLGKMVDRGDLQRVEQPRALAASSFGGSTTARPGISRQQLAALERALNAAEA